VGGNHNKFHDHWIVISTFEDVELRYKVGTSL